MQETIGAETVDLGGPRTIRNAEETRSLLLEALRGPSPIRLDCSSVAEADLSFVQLLLSARKSGQATGKIATLAHSPRGAFLQAASRAGFSTAPDPLAGAGSYWLEKE
ncbi:MAG: STAS domain-containing protein [Rhodomicrobium sp.]|jgi:anti-anti-sigma regulatory factor